MDKKEGHKKSEADLINEIQLLLAENRTDLAMLRTGIAVLGLPLSILGLLIATSKYWEVSKVIDLLVPLALIGSALVGLAVYLIIKAIIHIRRHDKFLTRFKKEDKDLELLVDE